MDYLSDVKTRDVDSCKFVGCQCLQLLLEHRVAPDRSACSVVLTSARALTVFPVRSLEFTWLH